MSSFVTAEKRVSVLDIQNALIFLELQKGYKIGIIFTDSTYKISDATITT